MILGISDMKTVADLQDKFNTFFPFLKIEFYEHPHHWYEGSPDKAAFPENRTIGEIRKNHIHGDLEIHSWFRTGDLEKVFRKNFDLNVQVFRLHRSEWVQTIGSDKLRLQDQNELGRKATIESFQKAETGKTC